MEFSIKTGAPEKLKTACIVVGVFESRKLSKPAEALDKASKSYLAGILKRGDHEGKSGSTLLLHQVPGIAAERVLLVGLGKADEFDANKFRTAVATAVTALKNTGAADAAITLPEMDVKDHDAQWRVRQAAIAVEDGIYVFDRLKSKKEDNTPKLARVAFTAGDKQSAEAQAGLAQGRAIAAGMRLTRDLGNLPGNICTPTYLAQEAQKLAKQYKLKCQVLERRDMEKLGMGALLSVAKGSHQAPKFIVLQYDGDKGKPKARGKAKPIVLVGKGITFDTGGISIKPAPEMDEMKYDMCGAATVLGTLRACAELALPLNVVGLIPTTENMPGGAASKPGDIVTSLSGQTIEILNTDAEGRLILCDALTYAQRFEPECVVDIATLTGACVIALGHVATGVMANDDELAGELLECGQSALDRAWQLPLWEDYQEQIKSPFADVANIGGRPAGTITAACFLSRFTKEYRWAHLDIAGTAWKSGKDKGATGRPVPLLSHFLIKRAGRL